MNNNSNFTNKTQSITENGYISLIFICLYGVELILGTSLNVLTIVVCMRKSLRKTSSFVIATFVAIANLLVLIMVVMPNFIEPLTGLNWESVNLVWCKSSAFFFILSYNWSGWLLVIFFEKDTYFSFSF